MSNFLQREIKLALHPDKVSICTLASGVDFLGWVHFLRHRVLRASTKRRMLKRIAAHPAQATIQSYLGLLQHGSTRSIRQAVLHAASLWRAEED
jgi:hypothetical protein